MSTDDESTDEVSTDESTYPSVDEPVEGCPDCRRDTVIEDENGYTFCTNCEWRP